MAITVGLVGVAEMKLGGLRNAVGALKGKEGTRGPCGVVVRPREGVVATCR